MTTIPTIHLNGTARKDLVEPLEQAVRAVRNAGKAVANTCPNARDYYVQGKYTINQALDEHYARLAKLAAVQAELEAIWLEIVR